MTAEDLATLLDLVETDDDRRCAEAALAAAVSLPLDDPAAEQARQVVQRLLDADRTRLDLTLVRQAAELLDAPRADQAPPPPSDDQRARRTWRAQRRSGPPSLVEAQAVAGDVRARLLLGIDFPDDLAPLASLPGAEARRLLSDLVELLLTATDASEWILDTATERLGEVVRAVTVDGTRTTAADLPSPGSWTVPVERRAWAGGLLTLVEPGQLLVAVRDQITAPDAGRRRAALRWLAAAAPRLGRPPQPLPNAASPADDLAQLTQLVESTVSVPRPTRSKPKPPPQSNGEPAPVQAAPPEPAAGPDESAWSGGAASMPATETESRTAYARLDAPDRVPPREVFELRVGLAPSPSRGVSQPPLAMRVPAGAFTLTVQLMADGFRLLGGGSLTREIAVSPEDPYPYDVLRLVPEDDPGLAPARTILAVFLVGGRMVGVASRAVIVAPAEADLAEPAPSGERAPGVDWVLPTDPDTQPDLEIVIAPGNDAAGRQLSWFYRSPHPSVGVAAEAVPSRLDQSAADYARRVMRGVEDHTAEDDLAEYLRGIGLEIQRAVPAKVWEALGATATVAPSPTVLLATWEPYVPWELARAPRPWDATGPPYLGAQAVLGRWTYSEQVRSPAPPASVNARSIAVVSGEYPGSQRLPEAEQEASDLESSYDAMPVKALVRPVLDCLKGTPPADIVHFAVHGKLDATGTQDGILMVDRRYLSPTSVRGVEASKVCLVFLNACQLGQSQQVLGEYAGMAAAFLALGVGGVVAPLWKVDDAVARKVAAGFYEAVLSEPGISPAEYLRRERRATTGREGSPAGTRLAYLFFGHPRLRVVWDRGRHDA